MLPLLLQLLFLLLPADEFCVDCLFVEIVVGVGNFDDDSHEGVVNQVVNIVVEELILVGRVVGVDHIDSMADVCSDEFELQLEVEIEYSPNLMC